MADLTKTVDVYAACKHGDLQLIIEVYDTFIYAYVKENEGRIVGDVWVINIGAVRSDIPWKKSDASPPFYNPNQFLIQGPLFLKEDITKLSAKFDDQSKKFQICLDDNLVCIVGAGDKPGFSTLSKIDSPVAKVIRKTGAP